MSEFPVSSESGLSSLRRQLSVNSEQVVLHLSQSLMEEKLLLALQAIKLAVASGRLTTEDARVLKRQMVQRVPFDTVILKKLSRAERFCLLDYDQREDDIDSSEEEPAEKVKAELQNDLEEVAELRKMLPTVVIPLCVVCDLRSDTTPGIVCENGSDPSEHHFQCKECLTNWVEVLNGQRQNNSDLLHARHGLVKCCAPGCNSPPYQRAVTCQNITRPDVLEGYLDNIQYCESLTLYEDYQRKLHDATVELREAIEREDHNEDANYESDNADDSDIRAGASSAVARLDKVVKRQELESLATTLKSQLPDARMCPQCHYGPMVHRACNDLQAHQNEVIDEIDHEDGTHVRVQIDNSCPQCKWLGRSWDEWLPWDGLLPTVLRGNAFRLAGEDASVKVLTPEEAREQRLLKLQKATSAIEIPKKTLVQASATSNSEPVSPAVQKTKQQLEEEAKKETYRKLQADKLRAKAEKERILKQFQADRR
jgi:hypothetical protein